MQEQPAQHWKFSKLCYHIMQERPAISDEYIAPELFLLLMTSLFTFYRCLLSAIIFCRLHYHFSTWCIHRHIYRKLDVQLPIRNVLKIVPNHSIICAWQVSQAQSVASFHYHRHITLYYVLRRVSNCLHFYEFPQLWLWKTFPILSDSIFLFLAGKRNR